MVLGRCAAYMAGVSSRAVASRAVQTECWTQCSHRGLDTTPTSRQCAGTLRGAARHAAATARTRSRRRRGMLSSCITVGDRAVSYASLAVFFAPRRRNVSLLRRCFLPHLHHTYTNLSPSTRPPSSPTPFFPTSLFTSSRLFRSAQRPCGALCARGAATACSGAPPPLATVPAPCWNATSPARSGAHTPLPPSLAALEGRAKHALLALPNPILPPSHSLLASTLSPRQSTPSQRDDRPRTLDVVAGKHALSIDSTLEELVRPRQTLPTRRPGRPLPHRPLAQLPNFHGLRDRIANPNPPRSLIVPQSSLLASALRAIHVSSVGLDALTGNLVAYRKYCSRPTTRAFSATAANNYAEEAFW